MKKLVIACLLLMSTAHVVRADDLLNAIDAVDVGRVKYLLQKHTHLDAEYKNTLLKAAHKSSKEAKHKTKWLFRSGYDLLRLAIGSGFVGLGGLAVAGALSIEGLNLFGRHRERITVPFGVLGAGTSILGLTQMCKGWMLRSAHRRLKKAREIESAIVQMPVKHHHSHGEHHGHHGHNYTTHK